MAASEWAVRLGGAAAVASAMMLWGCAGRLSPPAVGADGMPLAATADPTVIDHGRYLITGCEFVPWTTARYRASRDRTADIFKDYEYRNPIRTIDAYQQEFLAQMIRR